MSLANLFHLQGMMFLLIFLGVLLSRMQIVTKEGNKVLTDLVIYVFLPCNIISAFQVEFQKEVLRDSIVVILISIGIQVICMGLSQVLYRKTDEKKRMVLQYATVCSNAGFLGNPVAESLYGQLGLLYASVYCIPQRIVMWSAGISYFTKEKNKKAFIKKLITHPCILAVIIGLVIFVLQLKLPLFLEQTIERTGSCTTAVSMILIGTLLGQVPMKSLWSKELLKISLIRLGVIPGIVFLGCMVMGIRDTAMGISVVLAAMPAGTTTAILAEKYHGDTKFASNCVVLTTALSMVCIPLWYYLISHY